jgi:hypothetical protein
MAASLSEDVDVELGTGILVKRHSTWTFGGFYFRNIDFDVELDIITGDVKSLQFATECHANVEPSNVQTLRYQKIK